MLDYLFLEDANLIAKRVFTLTPNICDSGENLDQLTVSLNVGHCWIVANKSTAIEGVHHGDGYSWLPEDQVSEELASCNLKALPLREGGSFLVPLYLIKTSVDAAGPGVVRLAEVISENVTEHYAKEALTLTNPDRYST